MKSSGVDENKHQEFKNLLLRYDWNPTAGLWWVSFAGGFASMKGGGIYGTSGYPYIESGAGVALAFGLGIDLVLTRNFVLRGRVEHLLVRPWIPESGGFKVDGWTLGATLVWFP